MVAPAPRVVVGVDGSPHSRAALRFAVDEARQRGARLEVVHSWHYPYASESAWALAYPSAFESIQASAQYVLDEAERAARHWGPDIEIEPRLVCGDPAATLIDRAAGADLLVVGSRGRGGFAGLLLGSVSHQCTQHAPCPVVVVPGTVDAPEGSAESSTVE